MYSLQVYNSVPVDLLLSGMSRERIVFEQGTFNCGILVSGVGGSRDPRRKWEEMGEQEREREREGERENVLKSVAFVCKMI